MDPLMMGVKLSYLVSFLEKDDISDNPSFVVFAEKVKRMTKNMRKDRSLALFLYNNMKTRHLVSTRADVFVSYAWNGGVRATMKALQSHFSDTDPFVWMDVAIVDQYAAEHAVIEFHQWAKTFRESLTQIGKAVLVLAPGEKPIATTRSWCCFEWTVIQQVGIPYEYCVDPQDEENLIKKMENGMGFADFNNLFSGINVEKAEAFKDSDQASILVLMKEIGILKVNDMIMNALKEWLLSVNQKGINQLGEKQTIEGAYLMNARGALHDRLVRLNSAFHLKKLTARILQGELDAAQPFFEQAVAIAKVVDDTTLVAKFLNNLALLLNVKGDFDAAEPLFREAIDMSKEVHGNQSPLVAIELNNLALLLKAKGKYDNAQRYCGEATGIFKTLFGDVHPLVATGLNNLAELSSLKGDYENAESLQKEALEFDIKVHGREHPDVARDLSNLAQLLSNKGDFVGAEPLFLEAIGMFKKFLGDDHPSVATLLNNLAQLLSTKGDYSEAEKSAREAVNIMERLHGRNHADFATCISTLANILHNQSKSDESKHLMEEVISIYKRSFGNDHPWVAAALNNLALMLRDTGKTAEARKLGQEAYGIFLQELGPTHRTTLKVSHCQIF
jgi:tetratricopeptide (TPR) repeat protein